MSTASGNVLVRPGDTVEVRAVLISQEEQVEIINDLVSSIHVNILNTRGDCDLVVGCLTPLKRVVSHVRAYDANKLKECCDRVDSALSVVTGAVYKGDNLNHQNWEELDSAIKPILLEIEAVFNQENDTYFRRSYELLFQTILPMVRMRIACLKSMEQGIIQLERRCANSNYGWDDGLYRVDQKIKYIQKMLKEDPISQLDVTCKVDEMLCNADTYLASDPSETSVRWLITTVAELRRVIGTLSVTDENEKKLSIGIKSLVEDDFIVRLELESKLSEQQSKKTRYTGPLGGTNRLPGPQFLLSLTSTTNPGASQLGRRTLQPLAQPGPSVQGSGFPFMPPFPVGHPSFSGFQPTAGYPFVFSGSTTRGGDGTSSNVYEDF